MFEHEDERLREIKAVCVVCVLGDCEYETEPTTEPRNQEAQREKSTVGKLVLSLQ